MSLKVSDFLYQLKAHMRLPLVINTNLPPILHHFRDIAFNRSKIAIFGYPSCNSPTEGFPWHDLRKIICGPHRMAKVPNAVEILPKISTAWVGCTSVTDRQTTDGRATAYSEFAKTNRMWYMVYRIALTMTLSDLQSHSPIASLLQELIRRWDSERELLRSAPGSYPNSLK